MRTVLVRVALASLLALAAPLAACGGEDGGSAAGPHVVVTTSILGDVVRNLVGDAAQVDVIMPPGSNPHDFAPSPRQAAAMREADVLVVNGLGFEASLLDTVAAAEADGTTVVDASDGIEPRALTGGDGAPDPHYFTDPVAMRAAAAHLAAALAEEVDGLDTAAYRDRVSTYLGQLDSLDREVTAILADVPPAQRTLVTNHEVFGYFAARYGFEVLGVVIPGGSTLAEPSSADLRSLADTIDEHEVPAVFAETSSPARLADALAAEGTDVRVVELYSESLGGPGSDGGTYRDMIRTDAERIAAALG